MKEKVKVARYRAKLKINDNVAEGFYCMVEGRYFIVLDDAELIYNSHLLDITMDGFVEIDPETLEVLR